MKDLVVQEDLKYVKDKDVDIGDDGFLIYDIRTDDPAAVRILILHRMA